MKNDAQHACCTVEEFKQLEQAKHYTLFSNPMLDILFEALKEKVLSSDAFVIWIYLKKMANSQEELAVESTYSNLQTITGRAKNTVRKALKELEKNFFISIEYRRNGQQSLPSLFRVRLPNHGMKKAQSAKDREQRRTKKLSTTPRHDLTGEGVKSYPAFKEYNINKNINNNISPTYPQNTIKPDAALKTVDCLLSQGKNEKIKTKHNPEKKITARIETSLISQLKVKKEQIIDIKARSDLAPQDHSLFCQRMKLQNTIDALEIQLASLARKKRTMPKNKTSETNAQLTKRRKIPKKLSENQLKFLSRKVQELKEKRLITNPKDVAAQIRYQLEHFNLGTSTLHGINIAIKLIRQGNYKTPAGY